MRTIIGLGAAGCNIADKFAQYSQYKIFKIDVGLELGEKSKTFDFPKKGSHEAYEESCPDMKEFFGDINEEVLFIVGGSGAIAGASLRILEQIRHCRISVLYIQPEYELLSDLRKKQERVTCGILQEFARSAMINRIYLVSNSKIEQILENVPAIGYYDKINDAIVPTLHMINVFNHSTSVIDTFSEPIPSVRISTIGIIDVETGEEKIFFDLDLVREKRYYYGINKVKLETDGKFFTEIKSRAKKSLEENLKKNMKVLYGLYSTEYEYDLGYILCHTNKIQLYNL